MERAIPIARVVICYDLRFGTGKRSKVVPAEKRFNYYAKAKQQKKKNRRGINHGIPNL